MAVKLLIGGSPCTYWSIAQKNNRETTAEGMGWELFKNYLIALEKFKPDYFIYENNKSMSKAIRDSIRKAFGFEEICINSALVSAQNRQRYYWVGKRNPDGTYSKVDVQQPEDRGILLKDILETNDSPLNTSNKGKAFCVTATEGKGTNPQLTLEKHRRTMVCEPINVTSGEKAHTVKAQYYKNGMANFVTNGGHLATAIAEPVRIPEYGTPDNHNKKDKCNCLTTSNEYYQYLGCAMFSPPHGWNEGTITYGKTPTLTTGSQTRQQNVLITTYHGEKVKDPKAFINKVYKVENGLITIKEKQYPIKLIDGYYIIRKLTVKECCRLQTMPDDYCKAVSNSQAYKGLGNGWTAEVIIHLLTACIGDLSRDTEIVTLSMYDGIGTGRYCLDKMGFNRIAYHAYEIDKYPIMVAKDNYPDIMEYGDAFALRNDDWIAPKSSEEWLSTLLKG